MKPIKITLYMLKALLSPYAALRASSMPGDPVSFLNEDALEKSVQDISVRERPSLENIYNYARFSRDRFRANYPHDEPQFKFIEDGYSILNGNQISFFIHRRLALIVSLMFSLLISPVLWQAQYAVVLGPIDDAWQALVMGGCWFLGTMIGLAVINLINVLLRNKYTHVTEATGAVLSNSAQAYHSALKTEFQTCLERINSDEATYAMQTDMLVWPLRARSWTRLAGYTANRNVIQHLFIDNCNWEVLRNLDRFYRFGMLADIIAVMLFAFVVFAGSFGFQLLEEANLMAIVWNVVFSMGIAGVALVMSLSEPVRNDPFHDCQLVGEGALLWRRETDFDSAMADQAFRDKSRHQGAQTSRVI